MFNRQAKIIKQALELGFYILPTEKGFGVWQTAEKFFAVNPCTEDYRKRWPEDHPISSDIDFDSVVRELEMLIKYELPAVEKAKRGEMPNVTDYWKSH